VLEGIVARISPMTKVQYAHGCHLADSYSAGIGQAVWMARDADVIVAVVGLSGRIEGEQGESSYSTTGGDRASLELPGVQLELLKELHKLGKPLIVVYLGGSAVDLGWAQENAAAVLCGWYPGQAGGEALAEAIFGHYNPAGRLPVTFYKSVEQLPPFEDYTMEGRTYRYFRGEPLYPFGYGLSYTQFAYDKLKLSAGAIGPGDALGVSVEVRNVGAWDGDEVVQVYLTDLEASAPVAIRRLAAFRRIHLKAGKKRVVKFTLPPAAMSMVDEQGRRIVEPGRFALAIGGGQPGTRSEMAGSGNILKQEFIVTGPAMEVDLVS
jgi:beta-glucosidase